MISDACDAVRNTVIDDASSDLNDVADPSVHAHETKSGAHLESDSVPD
jgi:hypothetical protein